MFNKNDPLVNSVKSIMEQSEIHRKIEAALCEELGISSRKQLPHEHQANYDALLEQRLDELSKGKVAAYAKKAVDDVSHDSFISGGASQAKSKNAAMKYDKSAIKRQKSVNTAIDKLSGKAKVNATEEVELDETSHKMKEALDPVGKEDADVNNDGKHGHSTDKYLLKRRQAIGQAIAKKRMNEQMQDGKNPVPPASAKERIQNNTGTGPKSSVDPSYKHQGPSHSDREEMNKKMEKLDEAAVSKKQQRIMGMALAMRRGESDRGSKEVAKIATDMPEKELEKFAKTKHKGLPEKKGEVKENIDLDSVMEEIARNLGEARMKKIHEDEPGTGDASSATIRKPTVAPKPSMDSTPDTGSGGFTPDSTSTSSADANKAVASLQDRGKVTSSAKPVATGIGKDASDERDAAYKPTPPSSTTAAKATPPMPPKRPANIGTNAADVPARGARQAGPAPVARPAPRPAPAPAKSTQMFASSQNDRDGESAASFFAADRQRQAERRGLRESLENTIRKTILKD